MNTLRTIVSELELALGRNMIANRPPVVWEKMIEQVKNKRASEMERMFSKNDIVLGSWVSPMGIMKSEIIEENNDPEYSFLTFGKKVAVIQIPQIINLVNAGFAGDHGIQLVATADGRCVYDYVPPSKLGDMIEFEKIYSVGTGFYTYYNNRIIAYPAKDHFTVRLVLFDPLEGYVIDTRFRNSGELVIATDYNNALEYEVYSGQVEHDGIIYNAGESFTAVTTTFVGNGKVRLKNSKRLLNEDDLYPIDSKSKDVIIKRIIGEDYGLELQLPVDTKADGKHQSALNEDLDRIKSD